MTPQDESLCSWTYPSRDVAQYMAEIKNYMKNRLFDPYSAVYEFSNTSSKVCFKRNDVVIAGYLVTVGVNAKNRMGGYTGSQVWGFVMDGPEIVYAFNPDELPYAGL